MWIATVDKRGNAEETNTSADGEGSDPQSSTSAASCAIMKSAQAKVNAFLPRHGTEFLQVRQPRPKPGAPSSFFEGGSWVPTPRTKPVIPNGVRVVRNPSFFAPSNHPQFPHLIPTSPSLLRPSANSVVNSPLHRRVPHPRFLRVGLGFLRHDQNPSFRTESA